jgi:hypothetical protein
MMLEGLEQPGVYPTEIKGKTKAYISQFFLDHSP